MLKVTTSWDDGHVLDIRLSAMLDMYGLKGTFYIAPHYLENERLSDREIQILAERHEIGAHTIHHLHLTKLSHEEAWQEIKKSKQWVESLIGQKCHMFCYPAGQYNETIKEMVKKAGFLGARTTERFSVALPHDPFLMPTTVHVYPFPLRKTDAMHYYWGKLLQPLMQNYPGARRLGVPLFSMRNWLSLAKKSFDCALEKREMFHVWGHSWEIEKYNMWQEFEEFCRYISRRNDCLYLSNSEILEKK